MTGRAGSPRVAALLPAWNSAAFIEPTLEALAAQTYGSLEVLISDDASTDETHEICARFVLTHPRFRLMRQAKRQGWVGNVNALLREAEADYFFFAFHDDPPRPTYVASLVASLESNPRAVLAFSDVELDVKGTREHRSYTELDGVRDHMERARRVIDRKGLWWIPNRGLFRAEAAARIGGMRRHLAGEYSADWPWLLHLALLGEFMRVPRPLITKVMRKGGLSMSWKPNVWNLLAVATACSREIARSGIPIPDRMSLYRSLALREIKGMWWHIN